MIVAHGERGGRGDDRIVHELTGRLPTSQIYSSVQCCFISKEPSLKRVLEGTAAGPVTIYPLFMSDGYFVSSAIPRAIAAAGQSNRKVTVLAPLGLDSGLPGLVAELAQTAASGAARCGRDCSLLLAAHGSRHDDASRRATERVAADISEMKLFADVTTGFLEEEPFLEDRIATVAGPVIAVGLFAGQGMHGKDDLSRAIAKSGRMDVTLAAPLAQWPDLGKLICRKLTRPDCQSQPA